MTFVLKAKHWQVFLFLIIVMIITEIKIENSPTLTVALNTSGALVYFIWPLIVGHELQNFLPKKVQLNYTFFMINGFLLILVIFGSVIITDGGALHLKGFAALPGFYLLFAWFYVFSFPGRIIRSIENNKESRLSDSIGDFFLTFFLPFGIWFLQPRINKIVETEEES